MTIAKSHRFPASVQWRGGRLVRASAPGKPSLEVATPARVQGGIEGIRSPEELLVASASSCLGVTLAAVAEASGVELGSIKVDGLGHVERGADGRFQFVSIELTLEVEAEGEHPHAVQRLIEDAERLCIVSAALGVPVRIRLVQASALGVALSG